MRAILALLLGAMMIRNLLGGLGVNVHLALITLALVAGFAAGWQGASWKHERATLEAGLQCAKDKQANTQELLKQIDKLEKKRHEAERIAEAERAENARVAGLLRADVGRLRVSAADSSRVAAASREAVNRYAITASELLNDCAEEYSRVAIAADGHVADVRKMMAAWPKN